MSRLIALCVLQDYSSLEEYLIDGGVTKSHLKKINISKAYLQKSLQSKDEIFVSIECFNRYIVAPVFQGENRPRIIKENDSFLAVYKPENCHSHPLGYEDQNNVLSFLRENNYKDYLSLNNQSYDKGLLFRLDYETSGVLIFTKKSAVLKAVRDHFSTIVKKKIYLAIVSGKVSERANLKNKLSTSGKKIKTDEGGKTAELNYTLLEYCPDKNLSLIKVELLTGLRHQIRAQLSEIGHPILGDALYQGEQAQRLYLHAFYYQIETEVEASFFAMAPLKELSEFFLNADSCLNMLGHELSIG